MKLGVCSWACARSAGGRRDVVELAELVREAGFTCLEVGYADRGAVHGRNPPPHSTAAPLASLATLELHRFSMAAANPRHREAAHATVDAMLRCAAAWGIPSVSVSPGTTGTGMDVVELVAALAPHAALAEELDVALALENVPGHILARRETMAAVISRLPTLGVCLDVGNTLVDPPLAKWCAAFGNRITKIHLSDGRPGARWCGTGLGEGEVDWREVRAVLADSRLPEVFVEVPWDGVTPDCNYLPRLAQTARVICDGVLD